MSAIWNDGALSQFLPRLRHLTVYGTSGNALQISALRFASLNLLLVGDNPARVVITEASDLQTIELGRAMLMPPTGSFVTLPTVQVRKAKFYSPASLKTLVLPSLQSLYMGNYERTPMEVLFKQFLARSTCSIQRFCSAGIFHELQVVLAQLPPLQYLDLSEWRAESTDMHVLLEAVRRQSVPPPKILSVALKQQKLANYIFDLVDAWSHFPPQISLNRLMIYYHDVGALDREAVIRICSIIARGIIVQMVYKSVPV